MADYFDAKFKCNENFLMANLLAYSYKFSNRDSSYYKNANINEQGDIEEFIKIAKEYPAISSLVNYADEFDKQTNNNGRNKIANNMLKKLENISKAENNNQLVNIDGNDVKEAFDKLKETNFYKLMLNKSIEHKENLKTKFNSYKQKANEVLEPILKNIDEKEIKTLVLPPQLFDDPYAMKTNGNQVVTIACYPEYFNEKIQNLDVISMMHEIMHTYIPVDENIKFENVIQEDIYKVVNHCLVELSSNGELGKEIGKVDSSFGTPMHQEILRNRENGEILKKEDYIKAGVSFSEKFEFESSTQGFKNDKVITKADELSNDKIRGIVYPYFLAFKNKGKSVEDILRDINKDKKAIIDIYGKEFYDKIGNEQYLENIIETVKETESIIELNDIVVKDAFGIEIQRNKDIDYSHEQSKKISIQTVKSAIAQSNINTSEIQEQTRQIQDIRKLESKEKQGEQLTQSEQDEVKQYLITFKQVQTQQLEENEK